MAQWLISYRLRRIFRKPSGELEYSGKATDRMEFTSVHPAVFVARSAAAVKTFTDQGNSLPDDIVTCDRIETIHSTVYIQDDVLTSDQQQILEEAYAEPIG